MPHRHSKRTAGELALLQRQIAEARTVLADLQDEIADARKQTGKVSRADLLEVNERLVVAAIRNQTEADSAIQALSVMTRSSGLDALTQLPNRALLHERFVHAITIAKRHRTSLALLFIDLDDFKLINDSWGHAPGDDVLRQTSRCLVGAVRDCDTVSRYGGDEFLILLTDIKRRSDVDGVCDKVHAAIAATLAVNEHPISLSVSIGYAIYPEDGNEPEALMRHADDAMYKVKRTKLRRLR